MTINFKERELQKKALMEEEERRKEKKYRTECFKKGSLTSANVGRSLQFGRN